VAKCNLNPELLRKGLFVVDQRLCVSWRERFPGLGPEQIIHLLGVRYEDFVVGSLLRLALAAGWLSPRPPDVTDSGAAVRTSGAASFLGHRPDCDPGPGAPSAPAIPLRPLRRPPAAPAAREARHSVRQAVVIRPMRSLVLTSRCPSDGKKASTTPRGSGRGSRNGHRHRAHGFGTDAYNQRFPSARGP
jgi:hypothetical protein